MKGKDTSGTINISNKELAEVIDKGSLFQTSFMEGFGRGICGRGAAGGASFFVSPVYEYNKPYHMWVRGSGEELPGGKDGSWVVIYFPY